MDSLLSSIVVCVINIDPPEPSLALDPIDDITGVQSRNDSHHFLTYSEVRWRRQSPWQALVQGRY